MKTVTWIALGSCLVAACSRPPASQRPPADATSKLSGAPGEALPPLPGRAKLTPRVEVTADEILFEGERVTPVKAWAVPDSDLRQGLWLPRLLARFEAHRKLVESDRFWTNVWSWELVAHPDTPFRIVASLLYTAGKAEYARFTLLVPGAPPIPLALPPTLKPAVQVLEPLGGKVPPRPTLLQAVVAIAREKLLVFSLSGEEGSLASPRATIPAGATPGQGYDLAALARSLADLKSRHPAETRVILMVDPSVTYRTVLSVLKVLRQSPDGKPLFPDVLFSAAF
jgi:hypothetical protein